MVGANQAAAPSVTHATQETHLLIHYPIRMDATYSECVPNVTASLPAALARPAARGGMHLAGGQACSQGCGQDVAI
jgi:hypothetical protein